VELVEGVGGLENFLSTLGSSFRTGLLALGALSGEDFLESFFFSSGFLRFVGEGSWNFGFSMIFVILDSTVDGKARSILRFGSLFFSVGFF
jgi:hypothetical protein